jgi:hypothetical protein
MSVSALFSFDDVKPLVGERFLLRSGQQEVAVTLSEATSLGFNRAPENGGRESFSLLFHAPTGTRAAQGTYEISHPLLGTHSLFVVPLGPDATGLRLQLVFNFV